MFRSLPWRAFLVGAAVGAGLLTVGQHVWRGHLPAQIAADSTARVAQVAKVDTLFLAAAVDSARSVRADSGWDAATRLAALAPSIISSQAPDSTKIHELAAIIDTLVHRGDSLRVANDSLRSKLTQVHVATLAERADWTKERTDLASALAKAERRWTLGCTGGYGVIVHDGAALGGPGASCGVTWHW